MLHRYVRFVQKRGYCQEHPRLRPPHIRGPDGARAKHSIVKEAPIVPHVIHGPPEDGGRQSDIARVKLSKREECDDALRHTMNVDRIVTGMKVSGGTVLPKKGGTVVLEPASGAGVKLQCL